MSLRSIDFPEPLEAGLRVLPSIVGPVTRFNAEGKFRIRRDLKKETAFREVEWHWTERHGSDRVERSDFTYVPYERYPRELIPPPALELTVHRIGAARTLAVLTEGLTWSESTEAELVHAINLTLEIFGECEVLDESFAVTLPRSTKRLNWRLLPPGPYPWKKLDRDLQPLLAQASKGKRPVISHRLEVINQLGPDFHAVGQGGFGGYVVFGFRGKLFVLESALHGNATYIFAEAWEELSRLSKAQILAGKLQEARLVHQKGWADAVAEHVKRETRSEGTAAS